MEKQAKVKTGVSISRRQDEGEEGLLKLAREQGMNTDVRRSVFVILMTSEVSGGDLSASSFGFRLSRSVTCPFISTG